MMDEGHDWCDTHKVYHFCALVKDQQRLARIRQLLVHMDSELTGRGLLKAEHTMFSQQSKVAGILEGNEVEYFLSDGGYSRIWIDPIENRVFVTDNSTAKVKANWNSVSERVVKLKTEIQLKEDTDE